MRKLLSVIVFSALFINIAEAQQPKKPNSVEIHEAIKKLNFLGSVLYVAAHPDDENTRLISYMANQVKARTAYLSLTRGDGGQNLIGPEIRELLGVIRTQELLAARNTDGGEQIFTRANDFGYSKHPDETLAIWDKKEVLNDVVWAIRKFQPDVIINRFNHRTPGSTHGHHTSSAMLSVEAFDLVADKNVYPDQLKYVDTWQPKRLFFNTSWWFYGSREKFEKADKSNLLEFDTGIYYPDLGLSNTEIASLSRSQHKSQGFGSTGTRGAQTEYVELIKGELPKDKTNIFDGIDTSWNRVKGGKAVGDILYQVEKDFDFKNPAASVNELIKAYQLIQGLENDHWKVIKTKEIKEIIAAVTGLYIEAVATEAYTTPNSDVTIKIEAINRSNATIQLKSIDISSIGIIENIGTSLETNKRSNYELKGKIISNTKNTTPYWLNSKGTLGMYSVNDQKLIGTPETEHQTKAIFNIEIGGIIVPYLKDIVYKTNDPVKGEVYKPFEIIPTVSASIKDKVIIYANNPSKQIPVTLKSSEPNIKGTISLKRPEGWKVSPEKIDFKLAQKGEEKTVIFTLTAPQNQSEGYISPQVNINGKTYSDEIININYDHIPYQTVVLPSETKVVRLDIKKKGQNIGYIEGAGDVVPESLEQIGYKVTTISPESIALETLQAFDAIVIGIRAYNTVEELKFRQKHLLEYVKNGGNLVIQYNTNRRLKVEDNLGPYPLKLSRDRVTDENATIKLLAKDHAVLNTPNKITNKDFEGWVQERGLYFPNKWSDEYVPIIAANDKGESEKKGALLIAKYGKGYYVYTGLSFFREFPAGVSGAYRLFANMLSLGK
ncbi:PIG-L family deacetylase [Aquimarina sp. MMG015]|uniref:PIG-L family deacetylase n=1 Tax=unclassified Aquimarina TaxID=2627091 RepID=UPI000E4DCFCC|nr:MULTISPECIES: PIG-L family deacetylase [unclassified Aquimarina]AXT55023.1 PIG-L family deacetylase [Aquimarina sp. AD1]MBQ4801976.1 PIG-L family deacetylase [Aquimarina sp. MMG015]RKN14878.1 PIG-L family deacetylase [Aquimarina sp. AD1]